MSEILLVNPRRRRARKKTTTRKRRPARRRSVARRRPSIRRRRRNPTPPGTRAKTRRYTRRRRKNPVLNTRNIAGLAQTAAKGAAGAIALDVALAYLPLPANFKAGMIGKVVKAAGAVALGVLAKKSGMVRDATARDMTVGALTVQFTGLGRDLLGQFAPGVALSAYMDPYGSDALGYAGSGWNPSQALSWGNSNGMSAYLDNSYPIEAPGDNQPGMNAYEGDVFGW